MLVPCDNCPAYYDDSYQSLDCETGDPRKFGLHALIASQPVRDHIMGVQFPRRRAVMA